MITIPANYKTTIIAALKLQKATFGHVLSMNQYQLLEQHAQLQQFAWIKEAMKSKDIKDLVEDMEIKGLLEDILVSVKKQYQEAVELLDILEK